ncbi:TetR/AcrR family transcriptional regulator [Specibacter cremeus]|uniref:TetR/AcrR family transcriptional regulator n=1 Tax=Specibacter cremeus TaxID=1629051 RepID=UPI00197B7621|nr:TetR/AcrR family transcriptional regulator [Specibacter cremeus]
MARRGSYAKGVAKREEILATALEVVASNGYRNTSVRELADAVGLSQAGLLHYFSSKDELFAAIVRRYDEANLAASGADALAGFVEGVRRNANVPGLIRVYAQFAAEATDEGHPSRPHAEARYARLHRRFAATIRARQDAGTMRADVDPGALSVMTIALADGLQTQWLLDPGLDMAAHIEAFWALLAPPG